jgi:hypothetical protein
LTTYGHCNPILTAHMQLSFHWVHGNDVENYNSGLDYAKRKTRVGGIFTYLVQEFRYNKAELAHDHLCVLLSQKYEYEMSVEGNTLHPDLMDSTKPLCLLCRNNAGYRLRDLNSFTHFEVQQSIFHR